MNVVITAQELNVRKSNGSVYICRSCKDNRDKILMLAYDPNGNNGVYYQFCNECLVDMGHCVPCSKRKLPTI
jgi:hypothetical protein